MPARLCVAGAFVARVRRANASPAVLSNAASPAQCPIRPFTGLFVNKNVKSTPGGLVAVANRGATSYNGGN